MTAVEQILLIAGMTLVTFSIRYPILVLVGRLNLPPGVFQTLRYVPVAVLTAIIAPIMLMPENTLDLHPSNAYLMGGLVAIFIAAWKKKLLLTITVGMVAFFAWRLITGS
jgi:branched-subunit amino acid transport protein